MLTQANRCWLDLLAAGTTSVPRQRSFAFCCPTATMAHDPTAFLRQADRTGHAGLVMARSPTQRVSSGVRALRIRQAAAGGYHTFGRRTIDGFVPFCTVEDQR